MRADPPYWPVSDSDPPPPISPRGDARRKTPWCVVVAPRFGVWALVRTSAGRDRPNGRFDRADQELIKARREVAPLCQFTESRAASRCRLQATSGRWPSPCLAGRDGCRMPAVLHAAPALARNGPRERPRSCHCLFFRPLSPGSPVPSTQIPFWFTGGISPSGMLSCRPDSFTPFGAASPRRKSLSLYPSAAVLTPTA